MFSDSENWTAQDVELYARLTRVQPTQLIRHRAGLETRDAYFSEIQHSGDLFLDPDTGIATGRVAAPRGYVMPGEIGRLLDSAPARLLAVYQHVRAQPVRVRVTSVLALLQRNVGPLSSVSYESGTVAMLFLSRERRRAAEVDAHFTSFLGRHATGRIRKHDQHEV